MRTASTKPQSWHCAKNYRYAMACYDARSAVVIAVDPKLSPPGGVEDYVKSIL